MRTPWLWAVLLCGACTSGEASLLVKANPRIIDGQGKAADLTLIATDAQGNAGKGSVTLSSSAGVLSDSSRALDEFGTAHGSLSCVRADDPSCTGVVTVSAAWRTGGTTVEAKVTVTVADEVDAGGTSDAGATTDAGTPADAGTCTPTDGGTLSDAGTLADGGPAALMEGQPCTAQAQCAPLACSPQLGASGISGFRCTACSTSAAVGTACGNGGRCLLLVSASGSSMTCTLGMPGDPCSSGKDCHSCVCDTTVTAAGVHSQCH